MKRSEGERGIEAHCLDISMTPTQKKDTPIESVQVPCWGFDTSNVPFGDHLDDGGFAASMGCSVNLDRGHLSS
jgi:hypothetical protein